MFLTRGFKPPKIPQITKSSFNCYHCYYCSPLVTNCYHVPIVTVVTIVTMINVTKRDIELWIQTIAKGEFHYKEVLDGGVSPASLGKVRKYIHELCYPKVGEPICEPVGRRDGYYRPIQNDALPVDFTNMKERKDFPVILPFDLRKYVFLYPETVVTVGGSKSSGKTGFLYRTVALNLGKVNLRLLSNMEGGKDQMYDRFRAMGINLAAQPKFIYYVEDNFHDYVKEPDTLYIIDYIDAPDGMDFYLIGAAIGKIRKKLTKVGGSLAVVGLQKPYHRDVPVGGEQTLKNTDLYIAMDSSKLKIVDAKVPANKRIHPKNMQWTFQYDEEGTNFLNIQRYEGV